MSTRTALRRSKPDRREHGCQVDSLSSIPFSAFRAGAGNRILSKLQAKDRARVAAPRALGRLGPLGCAVVAALRHEIKVNLEDRIYARLARHIHLPQFQSQVSESSVAKAEFWRHERFSGRPINWKDPVAERLRKSSLVRQALTARTQPPRGRRAPGQPQAQPVVLAEAAQQPSSSAILGQRRSFALPPAVFSACAASAALAFGLRKRTLSAYTVIAGWSSQVARWAHNPKVAGSNPAPATIRPVTNPTSYKESTTLPFSASRCYSPVIDFSLLMI